MDKFTAFAATAAPYLKPNVDTDLIIRVERCARTPRAELGRYAFEMVRFLPDGADNPEFVLNQAPFRGAQILLGGENFGCGSSREMAVWAIAGLGMRCVIAPSFGEIFFGNCLQNGLLPVRLSRDVVERMGGAMLVDPSRGVLTVDLARQKVVWGDEEFAFEIDMLKKRMLLEGLDEIGMTLARGEEIAAFQQQDRARRPWIYV